MTEHVKGYKATLWSGMPKYGRRRTPYNVGITYLTKADLIVCLSGLHFCKRLCHVYGTYDSAFYTRVFAVEARGRLCSGGDKLCTDQLKFVKELTPEEVLLQLAGDANDIRTARFACNKAMNILCSVITREREIKDLNTVIVEARRPDDHMPALYHASRRFSWAQAFNEYSDLPICRVAMHYCGIDNPGLVKLLETLRQDLVLQLDSNKETRNED